MWVDFAEGRMYRNSPGPRVPGDVGYREHIISDRPRIIHREEAAGSFAGGLSRDPA